MIFSAIAQVIMLITNISILVNDRLAINFYKLYYISLPVLLYTVSYVIYYLINWKNNILEEADGASRIPITVALVINVVYCIIETIVERPENPWMYYICTVFIQLVNMIYLFNAIKSYIPEAQKRKEHIILQIFSYLFLFLGLWSMYSVVFLNVYIAATGMIATCIFSLISIFILYIILEKDNKSLEENNDDENFFLL